MSGAERSLKRILMTADTVGGVWTYALDLCLALQKIGIQVCLATMGSPLSDRQRIALSEIESVVLQESSFKLEWMDEPWEDVDRAGVWLLELERDFAPDLIHLNGYAHASLNWKAPVLVVAHSCVLSWWKAMRGTTLPAEWMEYRQRVQQGLAAADAVVAISNSYGEELQELYGSIRNLRVIYNGRSAGTFYAAEKKLQVFAMGRIWDEAKNLSLLGTLANKHEIPLLIAGDNMHPTTGEQSDIPKVQMLGLLPPAEIATHLAESYMFVLPARYEPFGLSVLEAALSGCLLILADIPVFRELWAGGAMYFNPQDAESLDYLLNHVFDHPQEYQPIIEKAKSRASLFSMEAMVEKYMTVYQSLVPISRSPQQISNKEL
jgi:glycogen(starch) synthase